MTDVVFFLVNLSEKGQGYLPCGTGIFVSNNAGLCVIIQVESGLQDKLRFMRPSEELRTIHRYIYIYMSEIWDMSQRYNYPSNKLSYVYSGFQYLNENNNYYNESCCLRGDDILSD